MHESSAKFCVVLGTAAALATAAYQVVCMGRTNCVIVLVGLATAVLLVSLGVEVLPGSSR